MTKQELYIEVAIAATGWGEGADFEMRELIGNRPKLRAAVEELYDVKEPSEDNLWCPSDDAYEEMTDEEKNHAARRMHQEECAASKAWEDVLGKVQSDSVAFLRTLLKFSKCLS